MSGKPVRRPYAIYFPVDTEYAARQSFKDECDINLIIARARAGQDISALVRDGMRYMDCSSIPDYRSALDIVRQAETLFESLDASIRDRFANDPGRMVEFCMDDRNYDEAVRLGLVEPKKPSSGNGGAQAEPGAPALPPAKPAGEKVGG